MSHRGSLFVALLWGSAAMAGEIRLVGEFPDAGYIAVEQWSARGFVRLNTTWERDEKNRPKRPQYEVFDFQAKKVDRFWLPIDAVTPEIRAISGVIPSFNVVHHDGQVTSLMFNEMKNYKTVAKHFAQYDHRTKQFSSLTSLGPHDDTRYTYELGFDGTDEHFYYAFAVNPAGNVLKDGFTAFELARIDLKTRAIDWTMPLPFAKRDKPLHLASRHFSPDGKRFALVEYNDVGIQRDHPPTPPQQVYVVDVEKKTYDTYPVPLSTYGGAFTPDGKYLLLGSNELGEVLRINLAEKKIDRTVKGIRLIHKFFLTPSAKSFLVIADTILASPKAIEVRRVDDLKLRTSIPMRMLYPGSDSVAPSANATADGRFLLLPMVDEKGWPARTGVRLYEIPDDVDSPKVGGVTADVATARAVVLGKQFADANAIRYRDERASESATFAPVIVTKKGDIVVTGFQTLNSDGDYKPGRTKPVVALLGPDGKQRWVRVLTKPGFLDYEAGTVAPTADGGCVVRFVSYVDAGQAPTARVAKLDAQGKTVWDTDFRRGGRSGPIADNVELLPDGSVSITGRANAEAVGKAPAWKAVIGPSGKVLSDVVGQ